METVNQLRDKGYMLLILSPEELKGIEPKYVENALQEYVPDIIESLQD